MTAAGRRLLSDSPHRNKCGISVRMEMEVSGGSRAHVSILPAAAEIKSTLKPEAERPRCASTPCSPIRGTVSGYHILHMDSNYLVGFTTGEELLKLAHRWSEVGPEKSPAPPSVTTSVQTPLPKSVDLGVHRSSRVFKAKTRYYQPYDIPGSGGRRRRRMPSSCETFLRPPPHGLHAPHAPLPLCLLKGKRSQSKSLDYLNLDRLSVTDSADTETLQYQLQSLTLRGERRAERRAERVFTRKT